MKTAHRDVVLDRRRGGGPELAGVALSLEPGGPFLIGSGGDAASFEDSLAADSPESRIGIFDSGLGGLSVAREIVRSLPCERIDYAADTANFPYGSRSLEEVRRCALPVMDELVASGVKLLVIGCNTASAACLYDARERYDIPVVGVVGPATRRALDATRNGRIGVIATSGTVSSRIYEDLLGCIPGVKVTSVACPLFADYVERGETAGREIRRVASAYLSPLRSAGVDTVVLGCTHYELLQDVIQANLGSCVTLVSCAEETVAEVAGILAERSQLGSCEAVSEVWHEIRSTRPDEMFKARLRTILRSKWWIYDDVKVGAAVQGIR
jgi:glutamate racemase